MAEETEDNITKIVVISSDSILPTDAAMKVYESEDSITIKETCFGTMVNGPREAVLKVVETLRSMDRNHIFVKERGFKPGAEVRCRAGRGGGPRPGFHFLREEVSMLPMIGRALDKYEAGEPLEEHEAPKKLDISKLKKIIDSEL
jgi:putative methanogenesis marker protein 6